MWLSPAVREDMRAILMPWRNGKTHHHAGSSPAGITDFSLKKRTTMKQIIRGKVPSKSNCYKVVVIRGHASLAKQKVLKDYEKSFYLQCDKYRDKDIKGLFSIRLDVFYENQRPDLDNCLKILLDCLQGCKAVRNDRNCVKITAEKFIDKSDPRVEFELEEVHAAEG